MTMMMTIVMTIMVVHGGHVDMPVKRELILFSVDKFHPWECENDKKDGRKVIPCDLWFVVLHNGRSLEKIK